MLPEIIQIDSDDEFQISNQVITKQTTSSSSSNVKKLLDFDLNHDPNLQFNDDNYDHVLEPEKAYSCSYCEKIFHNTHALGGHQNAHRNERSVDRKAVRRVIWTDWYTRMVSIGIQPHTLVHQGMAHSSKFLPNNFNQWWPGRGDGVRFEQSYGVGPSSTNQMFWHGSFQQTGLENPHGSFQGMSLENHHGSFPGRSFQQTGLENPHGSFQGMSLENHHGSFPGIGSENPYEINFPGRGSENPYESFPGIGSENRYLVQQTDSSELDLTLKL